VLRPVFPKPFEYQAFPFSPAQSPQHGRNTAVRFPFSKRETRRRERASLRLKPRLRTLCTQAASELLWLPDQDQESRFCALGDCNPLDDSHWLMWEAVSAWRARRKSLSRSMPGGVPRASLRRRPASSSNRCSRVVVCWIWRRCIGCSIFKLGRSATGVLITNNYHGTAVTLTA